MISRKILTVLYSLVFIIVLAIPALSDNPQTPVHLSLNKSFSQSTLSLNGSTVVTIIVQNIGGADASNVIIKDPVPDEFISNTGQNPETFSINPSTLKPGESREFSYTMTVKGNTQVGNHKQTDATATFQDLEGKSYTITSNTQPQIIYVKQSPGFEVVLAGIGILIALVLRRK